MTAGRGDFLREFGMFAGIIDFGMAEHFHAFTMRVVHHEEGDTILL